MSDLNKAIKIVNEGGIIIYPTDTAFGMGCRIDDEKAIKKIYEIRKRPKEKAMPVLFDSVDQVKDYILPFDEKVENLMKKYWPGALTLVLPSRLEKVPEVVRGGKNTLGIRIPDHELTLALIKGVGVPIIGTSANFAGEKTPFGLQGLDKGLIKLVDFVLEGKTKGGMRSSTVVDCSVLPFQIIRQGDIAPDL